MSFFYNKVAKYIHSLIPSIRTSEGSQMYLFIFIVGASISITVLTVCHEGVEQT